jgi:hypothetical protein
MIRDFTKKRGSSQKGYSIKTQIVGYQYIRKSGSGNQHTRISDILT